MYKKYSNMISNEIVFNEEYTVASGRICNVR